MNYSKLLFIILIGILGSCNVIKKTNQSSTSRSDISESTCNVDTQYQTAEKRLGNALSKNDLPEIENTMNSIKNSLRLIRGSGEILFPKDKQGEYFSDADGIRVWDFLKGRNIPCVEYKGIFYFRISNGKQYLGFFEVKK